MANHRSITCDIWEDEFFGSLTFFQQSLWTGLFSKMADDQGRLIDNPILILASIFPYKIQEITPKDVDGGLQVFAREGKILRYQLKRKKYIQIVNWWIHQKPQWAQPSLFPAPEGWTDAIRTRINGEYVEQNWHSGGIDEEHSPEETTNVQVNVQVNSQVNGYPYPDPYPNPLIKEEEGKKSSENPEINIYKAYEQEIGVITPMIGDELKLLEQEHPPNWIVEAFKISANNGKRNLAYPKAILQRWKVDGYGKELGKRSPPGKNGKVVHDDSEESRKRYITGKFSDMIEH